MSFSKRLKLLRENMGLSQEAVAEKLDIPRSSITHYENSDDRLPRRDRLSKIAKFFNVSIDYLIGDTNDPSPKENPSSNNLPTLTPKDERDIAKKLEAIINELESDTSLAFDGEPMDEHTRELVLTQIESNLQLAKRLAKKKFTPKKYRNE